MLIPGGGALIPGIGALIHGGGALMAVQVILSFEPLCTSDTIQWIVSQTEVSLWSSHYSSRQDKPYVN